MLQIKVKQCKLTLISAIIRNVLKSLKKKKKNNSIYGLALYNKDVKILRLFTKILIVPASKIENIYSGDNNNADFPDFYQK